MTAGPTDLPIIQTERRVLQALCGGTPQGSVREAAGLILKDYRWREPLHQAMFNILVSLQTDIPEVIRDHLPARLTRWGYPDVATDVFFQPHSLSKEEAEHLMCQLRDWR